MPQLSDPSLTEIRIAGFGGQGVILAAQIVGKAAAIFEGIHATMTQNFGPEARGGACSAQLIVSAEPVLYPYVTRADILVAMSQEAFSKFVPELKPGGLLLVERDLVRIEESLPENVRIYGVPATRIAEKLGKRVVQNIVMLGFFAAVAQVVSREALEKAVLSSVPESMAKLNKDALQAGHDVGIACLNSHLPATEYDHIPEYAAWLD
ncbi:MAG: 2-oxoacid:acceptor oxidoreductase family protein [Bryobacterales bacterium]|nr:2-oxoacid:acceptor oxidoreductase family protein [Bryobacterales bacterium]